MEVPLEVTENFHIEAPDLHLLSLSDGHANEETLSDNMAPLADPGRMRNAGYCPEADIDRLWTQKNRLDEVFDRGGSALYWQAREELFPAGRRGSKRPLGNRAGDKLEEISRAVGGLDDTLQPLPAENSFLDICGAPGAWSQYLFKMGQAKKVRMTGYGFSLRDGTNPKTCTWYESLTQRDDFHTLWGADGTGDACVGANISRAAAEIGRRVTLVVADGGFGVAPGVEGQHMENYQEIMCGRIILAEVLLMLETIACGGHFVCKLFDTFSHLTCSLLFVAAGLFKDVYIVKPRHSRVVNSERYLVGKHFKFSPGNSHFDNLTAAVRAVHASWPHVSGAENPWSGSAPLSVIPVETLLADSPFLTSVRAMSSALCIRQAQALEAVINRAEELCEKADAGADVKETSQRVSKCRRLG